MKNLLSQSEEERKKYIDSERKRWQSVIHGESSRKIRRFQTTLDESGKMKVWW